jgi:uncharacterized phage protein gp47/JayE
MVDLLDASGLTIATRSEIVTALETSLKAVYGNDINVLSNSPDGQMIGIFAQSAIDIRELASQVYASFDPDRATGRVLDERVAINNIQRLAGSFTIIPVTIVTDRTVTLQGLDALANDINGSGYTIQDGAGTKFILIDTITLSAGSHVVNFRAEKIGAVLTTTNTVTNQVTIVLGVNSVNNASGALQVGVNEETDALLRVRRQRSVALSSNGYLNGLLGQVLNLDGVTDAKLYENSTDSTDANGIPAHAIWLIVEGGSITDIANMIYAKKSFGCDMKGATTLDILTASGAVFTAKFDRPTAENLHIRFDIQKTVATALFDQTAIKNYMVNNTSYDIGQYAETSSITALALKAIQSTGAFGVPVNMEISKNGSTWLDFLNTTTLDKQFVVDTSRITITVL